MMFNGQLGTIEPRLLRCLDGGWLAVSPAGAELSIGVLGGSPEEARRQFEAAIKRWVAILDRRE